MSERRNHLAVSVTDEVDHDAADEAPQEVPSHQRDCRPEDETVGGAFVAAVQSCGVVRGQGTGSPGSEGGDAHLERLGHLLEPGGEFVSSLLQTHSHLAQHLVARLGTRLLHGIQLLFSGRRRARTLVLEAGGEVRVADPVADPCPAGISVALALESGGDAARTPRCRSRDAGAHREQHGRSATMSNPRLAS